MNTRQSLLALTLALACGSVLAATPAPSPAGAASKPAAAAPAKHKAPHCKQGETLVKNKCEKPKG